MIQWWRGLEKLESDLEELSLLDTKNKASKVAQASPGTRQLISGQT
jgi:hypothetical protein